MELKKKIQFVNLHLASQNFGVLRFFSFHKGEYLLPIFFYFRQYFNVKDSLVIPGLCNLVLGKERNFGTKGTKMKEHLCQ